MAGATLWETLRRNWLPMIYWGIGVGALGFMMTMIAADNEALQGYAGIMEIFPPEIMSAFGVTDVSALTTPEGFITFGFFTYGAIVLAVYAVMAGASVTVNDEDAGILDVVLSLPLSRSQLILETFVAHILLAIGVVAVSFWGILVGMVFTGLELNIARLVETAIAMIPAVLAVLAITVFVGAAIRRKAMVFGIMATIIGGGYFLNVLGEVAGDSFFGNLRVFSVFNYFKAEATVQNGANISDMLVLLVVMTVCIAGSLWAFERRDVGA